MTVKSRTGAGATTLALILLGAVICRCPMPMPMVSASVSHSHEHDCCPEEPSVRAVSDDCCADLPVVTTAIVKNERHVLAPTATTFELAIAPTLEVRSDGSFSIPVPPASPPLVLRI